MALGNFSETKPSKNNKKQWTLRNWQRTLRSLWKTINSSIGIKKPKTAEIVRSFVNEHLKRAVKEFYD